MKEEIKNPIWLIRTMETYCVNSKKNASNQLSSVSKTT